jgi:hypothetical protein
MKAMEWKSFSTPNVKIQVADAEDLTITHSITVEVRDRVGDVLRVGGCEILGKPVFLWQHGLSNYGCEPVGKPLDIRPGYYQGNKALIVKSQFYPDEFGRRLWEKCKGGYLSAFSVGFVPIESVPFRDDLGGRDIKRFSLIEYSLCAVGCNPYAQVLEESKSNQFMVFKMMPARKQEIPRPDIMCRLSNGRFCSLKELPGELQKFQQRVIREELDRLRGRVR